MDTRNASVIPPTQTTEDGLIRCAGPYKFVSFTPGIELVLEAFDGYFTKHT